MQQLDANEGPRLLGALLGKECVSNPSEVEF